jgi:hypothetical protein
MDSKRTGKFPYERRRMYPIYVSLTIPADRLEKLLQAVGCFHFEAVALE